MACWDDDFLKIFPEKSGDKGHTYPLHELWPQDFPFDPADKRGSRQYDEAVLASVRPKFEETARQLVEQTVTYAYAKTREPDAGKAIAAAEKNLRAIFNRLIREARISKCLDNEFEQHGLNALQSVRKDTIAKIAEWAAGLPVSDNKPRHAPAEPDPDQTVEMLAPLLIEFAKLDGYNVWRRSLDSVSRNGKLTMSDEGERQRVPTLLSWIVPVRQWAELESWGEDPETKQPIAKSTHKDGVLDSQYFAWLRDTLKVFDDDGTVKEDFLVRLDPDCLEALDFNLSAGRHKPFVFDAGQHRPPVELVSELQAIYDEVQKRLAKLRTMVGGRT